MHDPDTPGTGPWRRREADRLLDFAKRSLLDEGGFGWLDDRGEIDRSRGRELWITCRMTHVFGLAAVDGRDDARSYAQHGVRSLRTLFHDAQHGGWFSAVDASGEPCDAVKANYDHCFVLLAASTAHAAGLEGADELLDAAKDVVDTRFWDDEAGLCVESYARDWSGCEPYRGANSNMHAVEAFTACGDVTGEPRWRRRALGIADKLINGHARDHGWRLPEHFTADWAPVLEYNGDRRADPFRPYGSTVGHWLEWARLLIVLHEGLQNPEPWLLEAATALFEAAVRLGWEADGSPGFAYTLDWNDAVVVSERLHWVQAEAVLAADALHRCTGHQQAGDLTRSWWAFFASHFRDRTNGSWHHELDSALRRSTTVWTGKPDAYHVYQALVLPDLPLAPTAAAALAARDARR